MKKRYSILIVTSALLLSACGVGGLPEYSNAIQQPAQGYQAVRFKEFTAVKDHLVNTYSFKAGTVLIQDRETNGVPYYCGTAAINSGKSADYCFNFEGDVLVINKGLFSEVRRDLSGKIEHIRVRL